MYIYSKCDCLYKKYEYYTYTHTQAHMNYHETPVTYDTNLFRFLLAKAGQTDLKVNILF